MFTGTSITKYFGTIDISVSELTQYPNIFVYNVILDNSGNFTQSNEKLVMHGIPLSLAINGSNRALMVIRETDAESSGRSAVIRGTQIGLASNADRNYMIVNSLEQEATIVSSTMWHGIPLSVDSEDRLVFVEMAASSYDEIARINIANYPIEVRRIGSDWYLVVYDRN